MSFFFKSKKGHPNGPQYREVTPPAGSTGMGPSPSQINPALMNEQMSPESQPKRSGSQQEQYGDRAAQYQYQQQMPPHINPATAALYPWSQKRMNLSPSLTSPFPRYGHAANCTAGKEGEIYIMGGLIRSQTVRGDLWLVEGGGQSLGAYPVVTTSEGPGPRVGHAALLVGNAFIVFGGDTKMDERDVLDETLYLLNTSSRQWSRAQPTGLRPSGRYGHTLNILGSKLYVFGGQAEGTFFNDLYAFDLNTLQNNTSKWELTVDNNDNVAEAPARRTNHTVISWGDKLYLFGGTNGVTWFNDVWSYDPRTNIWLQLDCIGYIPSPREGHAASLVGDTMYIFGGRSHDGTDLGDLAAFRIPSRRWYTFQNMGPAPSPRSGHSMTTHGSKIVVLGGEPSVASRSPEELSYVYVLDTAKIRYPNDQQLQERERAKENSGSVSSRRPSQSEKPGSLSSITGQPLGSQVRRMGSGSGGAAVGREPNSQGNSPQLQQGPQQQPLQQTSPLMGNNTSGSSVASNSVNSRLPRASISQAPAGPPPAQQAPNPRMGGPGPVGPIGPNGRKTPTKPDRPQIETTQKMAPVMENMSPVTAQQQATVVNGRRTPIQQARGAGASSATPTSPVTTESRSRSRQQRQGSLDNIAASINTSDPKQAGRNTPGSTAAAAAVLEKVSPIEATSPVKATYNVSSNDNANQPKDVESLRRLNAWYASELTLARRAGYTFQSANAPSLLDDREALAENDRSLLEALVSLKAELDKVQGSVNGQAAQAAKRIAEVEKQRDTAISEAVYAKAKLAAIQGASRGNGALSPEVNNMEAERSVEMGRKLANALAAEAELRAIVEALTAEIESEKNARQLSDETATAAQDRVSELDDFRNRTTSEVESLRAQLLDAERNLRDESSAKSDAIAEAKLLRLDKEELTARIEDILEDNRGYVGSLDALKAAVVAAQEKSVLLERQLEEDRAIRENLERKLARVKSEYEERSADLESANKRLKDMEELADKHADEAQKAREAMVAGLQRAADREQLPIVGSAADERVIILQDQVKQAKAQLEKSMSQADESGEKLAQAMQRVAGLELMQAQASKEAIAMQRRMAESMEELRRLTKENTDYKARLERKQIDVDTANSKHNALKELLSERGISSEKMRSIPSPQSGTATPEYMSRLKELENQLDASIRAHNETKKNLQDAELAGQETEKSFSTKLEQLENDYQSVVHYVKGTEKMLKRMKEELTKYKAQNSRLAADLEEAKRNAAERSVNGIANGADAPGANAAWEEERNKLNSEIDNLKAQISESSASVERKLREMQTQVESIRSERDGLKQQSATSQKQLSEATLQLADVRKQIDRLETENNMLEARAVDAENKVSALLDQFESSVDAYRQSVAHINGELLDDNASEPRDSIYGGANRTSIALDTLATELDQLRSHWESNKTYRLSSAFDYDPAKTPTSTDGGELSSSLLKWRQRLDQEELEARKRSSSRTSDLTVETARGNSRQGSSQGDPGSGNPLVLENQKMMMPPQNITMTASAGGMI